MGVDLLSLEQGHPGQQPGLSSPASPERNRRDGRHLGSGAAWMYTYYEYPAMRGTNELLAAHEVGPATAGWTYYEYDHRGNCTEIRLPEGSTYFSYNDADLVTSVRYKSGICNYSHYDANLRRYALEDSAGLAYFTWDQNGMNLLAERDSTGEVTAEYAHGQTPINGIGSMTGAAKAQYGSTYFQYPMYDHRSSVFAILDHNGQVTDSYLYNAWGERLNASETGPPNRFGYQSNWIVLPDSGRTIYISPTRLYDATVGRFLQRDMAISRRTYKYAQTDPTSRADSNGALSIFLIGGISKAVPGAEELEDWLPPAFWLRHVDGAGWYTTLKLMLRNYAKRLAIYYEYKARSTILEAEISFRDLYETAIGQLTREKESAEAEKVLAEYVLWVDAVQRRLGPTIAACCPEEAKAIAEETKAWLNQAANNLKVPQAVPEESTSLVMPLGHTAVDLLGCTGYLVGLTEGIKFGKDIFLNFPGAVTGVVSLFLYSYEMSQSIEEGEYVRAGEAVLGGTAAVLSLLGLVPVAGPAFTLSYSAGHLALFHIEKTTESNIADWRRKDCLDWRSMLSHAKTKAELLASEAQRAIETLHRNGVPFEIPESILEVGG